MSHTHAGEPGDLVVEPDPELQTTSRLPEIIAAATRAQRDERPPSKGEVDLLRAIEQDRGAEWCLRTLRERCVGTDIPAQVLRSQAEKARASPGRRRSDAAEDWRIVGAHAGDIEVPAEELVRHAEEAAVVETWPECPGCRGRGCGMCGGTGRVSPAAVARGEVLGLELCRFCDDGRRGADPCAVCGGGRVLTVEVAL